MKAMTDGVEEHLVSTWRSVEGAFAKERHSIMKITKKPLVTMSFLMSARVLQHTINPLSVS